MASERMRMLIRKFEPSSDDISSRYLATPASSEVPQIAARAIFEHDPTDFHSFINPPVSDWSGLGCPGEPRSAPDCSQSYF